MKKDEKDPTKNIKDVEDFFRMLLEIDLRNHPERYYQNAEKNHKKH